jgi:phage recombination protein Bet
MPILSTRQKAADLRLSETPMKQQTQIAEYDRTDSELLSSEAKNQGLTVNQWAHLKNNLFPGARPEAILSVVAYCKARGLDPMKKPCHIVPLRVKNAATGNWEWRDVVMAGIYEARTTAMRTGQYAGMKPAEFGPDIDFHGVTAPEWCLLTVRRQMPGGVCEWGVPVYFKEAAAVKTDRDTGVIGLNAQWHKRPRGMLLKCAEASSLRMAFPDELGGQMTADEMAGQNNIIDVESIDVTDMPATRTEQVKKMLDGKPEKTEKVSADMTVSSAKDKAPTEKKSAAKPKKRKVAKAGKEQASR